jgi:hypothetical protein
MEANGLANFAEVARREVPDGSSLVARLLREHRARVLDGSGPAIMKQPDAAPYVEAIPAKEPTAMLFALRPIKWRDEFGKLRMGGKFQDCELPQRLAAKALQSGAVVSLDNPLRRQHVSQGGPVPRADTAFDLDETPPPEPERPSGELHSAVVEFQQIDRGPPRLMQVAR